MIYFIYDGDYIKIGYTTNIKQRLKNIATANPRKLELVKIIDGDNQLEYIIQEYFSNYHLSGEWFRYEGELYNYINNSLILDFTNPFLFLSPSLNDYYKKYPPYKQLTLDLKNHISHQFNKYKVFKYYKGNSPKFAGFIKFKYNSLCVYDGQKYYDVYNNTKLLYEQLIE